MTEADVKPASQVRTAGWLLPTMLVFDSLHFVFARALSPHLPGLVGAFYVIAVAAVLLGGYLLITRSLDMSVLRQHRGFFAAIGFLVASSTGLNYTAVNHIDAGTASLLSQTSTLFSLLLGVFWLGDRLRKREWIGAFAAVGGAFVISFQPGDVLRLGALMILASALMYASHAALVKRIGGTMPFVNFFFFRIASTATFLGVLALGAGQMRWPTAAVWPLLLAGGIMDVVVSRTLYYLALRRLDVSRHALLLTLSPVIVILWSFLLFAELPTWQAVLGGAIVIAGVTTLRLGNR